MTVVDNARFEPEQILLMSSSSPVAEKALAGKVSAYLLPVRHPKQAKEDTDPYRWDDESQIGKDILALSQPVSLSYVASEEGGNTSHASSFGPWWGAIFTWWWLTAWRASAGTWQANRTSPRCRWNRIPRL